MKTKLPLWLVVLALIVAAILVRFMFSLHGGYRSTTFISIYCGLLVGQVMLLGIWCGLANAHAALRFVAGIMGITYLWIVSTLEFWLERPYFRPVISWRPSRWSHSPFCPSRWECL